MKQYSFNGFSGCVKQMKNRITKTTISVYNCEQSDLDHSDGKWATVCEKHGRIINHSTLTLALAHATTPMDWCEECSGNNIC